MGPAFNIRKQQAWRARRYGDPLLRFSALPHLGHSASLPSRHSICIV